MAKKLNRMFNDVPNYMNNTPRLSEDDFIGSFSLRLLKNSTFKNKFHYTKHTKTKSDTMKYTHALKHNKQLKIVPYIPEIVYLI